jgi:hypothetical protein
MACGHLPLTGKQQKLTTFFKKQRSDALSVQVRRNGFADLNCCSKA